MIAGHIYWYVLAVTALAYGLLAVVRASAFGQALKGMRDNEDRMRALGYSVTGLKLAALVMAGGFAGVAGSLWVTQLRFVSPADVGFTTSAMALLCVVIAGRGSLWGSFAAAAVVIVVRDELGTVIGGQGPLVLGLTFIAAVYLLPRGAGGARAVGPAASSETGAGNGSGAVNDPRRHRGTAAAIEVRDLTRRFGGLCAVDSVSIRVEAGARHAVIGSNGAGKSTLFALIGGAQRPTSGVGASGRRRRDPAGRAPPGPAGPGPHVPARQPVRPGHRGRQRGAGGAALAGLRLPALARPAAGGGRRRPGGAAAGDGRT